MPGPGGSRAGRPNKNKVALLNALAKRFGKDWHPVMKMAEIAEDPENPKELRAQMYREVSQYVTPKLKAVEISGPDGEAVEFAVTLQQAMSALQAFQDDK